jgi:methylglyoxal synthase
VSETNRERAAAFYTRFEDQSIALIAHDDMKQRMVGFAIQYEDELCRFNRVLTTGRTGEEVESACRRLRDGGTIRRYLPGPKGGDIEIATEILFDRCHVVVFFVDPLHPHAHIDDIMVVFSACMAEIQGNDVRLLTNELHAREWMEEAVRRHR